MKHLTAEDAPALQQFFAGLAAGDRTFFWSDVTAPGAAAQWLAGERRITRAEIDDDGTIAAFGSLQGGTEFSSHVAELTLVVGPTARRRGLGRALARQLLLDALEEGYTKVTVQIAADNVGAIQMFQSIGFEGEALLRDHLLSPEDGQLRDLVLLAHLVDEQWSSMLTAGLDSR